MSFLFHFLDWWSRLGSVGKALLMWLQFFWGIGREAGIWRRRKRSAWRRTSHRQKRSRQTQVVLVCHLKCLRQCVEVRKSYRDSQKCSWAANFSTKIPPRMISTPLNSPSPHWRSSQLHNKAASHKTRTYFDGHSPCKWPQTSPQALRCCHRQKVRCLILRSYRIM